MCLAGACKTGDHVMQCMHSIVESREEQLRTECGLCNPVRTPRLQQLIERNIAQPQLARERSIRFRCTSHLAAAYRTL